MPPKIVVRNLGKTFPDEQGGERVVLDHLSLAVGDGAFVSIIGPSGCGKSTTLNIIAGLVPATAGVVEVAGEPVGDANRRRARIGYVFQQPRLLNWLTVGQNIEFVLQAAEVPRSEWPRRVADTLNLVGLEGFRDMFPLRLSGGQQQRVSIGRALATEPEVVLMDEPFSHLDEITAARLRAELIEIWRRTGKTVLFVTHDISEAIFLSERIVVLGMGGRVIEELHVAVPWPRVGQEEKLFEMERRVRFLTAKWWGEPEAATLPARGA